jgi:hypothetical protein
LSVFVAALVHEINMRQVVQNRHHSKNQVASAFVIAITQEHIVAICRYPYGVYLLAYQFLKFPEWYLPSSFSTNT